MPTIKSLQVELSIINKMIRAHGETPELHVAYGKVWRAIMDIRCARAEKHIQGVISRLKKDRSTKIC